MYVVKLADINTGTIFAVYHFKHFQNAIACAFDTRTELYCNVPEERLKNLGKPTFQYFSINNNHTTPYPDDFSVRYDDGLYAYIGEVCCNDSMITGEEVEND